MNYIFVKLNIVKEGKWIFKLCNSITLKSLNVNVYNESLIVGIEN